LESENKLTVGIDDDIFVNDPNLERYLQRFVNEPMDEKEYLMSAYGKFHPRICLCIYITS
jgi:hypothetical protein